MLIHTQIIHAGININIDQVNHTSFIVYGYVNARKPVYDWLEENNLLDTIIETKRHKMRLAFTVSQAVFFKLYWSNKSSTREIIHMLASEVSK